MTEPPDRPALLRQAALDYVDRGWAVIQLHWITDQGVCSCRAGADCKNRPGKHPIGKHGLKDPLTDPNDIDYFWEKTPLANIGIVCGASGLAVIDIDGPDARALLEEHVDLNALPPCPVVKTGRGWHLYFTDTSGGTLGSSIGQGIDLRAGESYVIAPPSNHVTGNIYTWARQ